MHVMHCTALPMVTRYSIDKQVAVTNTQDILQCASREEDLQVFYEEGNALNMFGRHTQCI